MNEDTRYSEHPEVQWALDLLKPDPNYKQSVLQTYSSEIVCVLSGFAIMWSRNYRNRLPIYAGIQGYAIAGAVGYVISQGLKKAIDNFYADRDTRLREYIIAHPDLFPEPARMKYKDFLQPWTPIR